MEIGNRNPEKLIAGSMENMAEAKIAAICVSTKQETSRPKAVDARIMSTAPSSSAGNDPRIGTPSTNTAQNTRLMKLSRERAT